MAITRTAMIDDDGSGTTGTVINAAWKTELYNQIDAMPAAGAPWVDVAFNAANFSTPTGGAAWTVTGANYSYLVLGKLVHVSLGILGTSTVTGAPVRLHVTLPGAVQPLNRSGGLAFTYAGGGALGTGVCLLTAGSSVLDLLRDANGSVTFPAGSYQIYLQGFYSIA